MTRQLRIEPIEKLRTHMRLTNTQMAQLCGVSRITYYNWVRGSGIREANHAKVSQVVKSLLKIAQQYQWPMRVADASSHRRFEILLDLLAEEA